jgi:hypothetical protein
MPGSRRTCLPKEPLSSKRVGGMGWCSGLLTVSTACTPTTKTEFSLANRQRLDIGETHARHRDHGRRTAASGARVARVARVLSDRMPSTALIDQLLDDSAHAGPRASAGEFSISCDKRRDGEGHGTRGNTRHVQAFTRSRVTISRPRRAAAINRLSFRDPVRDRT